MSQTIAARRTTNPAAAVAAGDLIPMAQGGIGVVGLASELLTYVQANLTALSQNLDANGFTIADAVIGLNGVAGDFSLVTNASGIIIEGAASSVELGYLAGVTSAIQTQLNLKAPLANPTFTGVVALANGTAGAPSLHLGDATTGFYRSAVNVLSITTAGTHRWNVNASGHFLAATDNSFDIGASGATRPRTGYFGTSVQVGSSQMLTNGFLINPSGYFIGNSDGVWQISNQSANGFSRLQFGGTTSSFPSLKRSAAELHSRLADDSADASLQALSFKVATLQVLGAQRTGWSAATGGATRTTFDTATVTLPQLAERMKALLDDLLVHGVIGA